MKQAAKKAGPAITRIGGKEVKLTNQDKIFWPEEKFTKGDVVRYYQAIASYILPYLKNRPQSLKRNPGGITDPGFYQKDAGDDTPPWLKTISLYSESADRDIDYILCNDKATLAYLNNLGCIELNPWHSTVSALDNPDYMIIDIDPSDGNSFEQVIECAAVIHELFRKAGADHYCKTSGASGIHIYVPTGKKYTYDQIKDFAELICQMAHEQLPEFTSMERNLKKRGMKIYMDHLQNRKGQTIASVYSLRPYPGATVSAPLEWKEVKPGLSPLQFTIKNMAQRIEKKGDLFKAVLGKGIDLRKCLKALS